MTTPDPYKEIKFLGLFLAILLVMLFMVSCKAKHKVIERQKEVVETKKSETLNEIIETDIKIDSFAKTGSNHVITNEIKSIKLTQADTSKTITISDNKGFKLTIKGANAVIDESNNSQIKKDSSSVGLSKIDKSVSKSQSNKKEASNTKTVARKADSDVKTTSTWLWIALIVIVGLYFWLDR